MAHRRHQGRVGCGLLAAGCVQCGRGRRYTEQQRRYGGAVHTDINFPPRPPPPPPPAPPWLRLTRTLCHAPRHSLAAATAAGRMQWTRESLAGCRGTRMRGQPSEHQTLSGRWAAGHGCRLETPCCQMAMFSLSGAANTTAGASVRLPRRRTTNTHATGKCARCNYLLLPTALTKNLGHNPAATAATGTTDGAPSIWPYPTEDTTHRASSAEALHCTALHRSRSRTYSLFFKAGARPLAAAAPESTLFSPQHTACH